MRGKNVVVFVWLNCDTHLTYGHGVGLLANVAKEAGFAPYVYHVHESIGHPADIKKVVADIKKMKPNVIGISTSTLEWGFAKSLAKEFREVLPDVLVVCGGPHPTFEKTREGFENFHVVVRGEGVVAIRDILENRANFLKAAHSVIVGRLAHDLDSLSFDGRVFFEMQKIVDIRDGILDLITQMGCPHNCSYCSNHALRSLYGKKFLRQRSVGNVLSEVRQITKRYSCTYLFFQDDIFTLRPDWVLEFCSKYKKEFHYPWIINSHFNSLPDRLISFMAEAGCCGAKMGVETGDEDLRRRVLNKVISNKKIIAKTKLMQDCGIRVFFFLMHGVPEEKESSRIKTVRLLAESRPNSFRSAVFFPLPNTALGDKYGVPREFISGSTIGDKPFLRGAGEEKEIKNIFYTIPWRVNLERGLKEYKQLIDRYSGCDDWDTERIRQDDNQMSLAMTSKKIPHYKFGPNMSICWWIDENGCIRDLLIRRQQKVVW